MIRRRLSLTVVAAVAATVWVAGFAILGILESRLVEAVDRELATVVDDRSGQVVVRIPPRLVPGSSPFDVREVAFVHVDPAGRVLSAVPTGSAVEPDPLPDVEGLRAPSGPLTVGAAAAGGPRFRVLARPLADGGMLVAGLSLADVDRTVDEARRLVLAAGLAALAAVAVTVWLAIRRGLRPIDRMIATAERIAAGDLAERVDVSDPGTEVGQLATALNTMLDRIEDAVDSKTESEARMRRFVADASHELRTPLTSIRGYAELHRRGANDPEAVALGMSRIEHEAERMGTLVEDLLLLARLDQRRPLETAAVDLVRLVSEAVAAARTVDPGRRVELDVPDGPVTVTADRPRLRQVLDNLLANVRAHTPPGAPASVTLRVDSDVARLEVADTGPGMPAQDVAQAFDRFWQGERGAAARGRGSGLGLSIVREIVSAHGGTVELRSRPGEGTTVAVALQVRHGSQEAHGRDRATSEVDGAWSGSTTKHGGTR